MLLLLAAFGSLVVAAVWRPLTLIGLAALPVALAPARAVHRGADGPDLIPVLGATGRLQLAVAVLATVGLALGG